MPSEPLVDNDTKISTPKSRYLLYTSAGARNAVRRWLRGERNFDLWVTDYSDGSEELRTAADFYNRRRGGKFPNLHHAWQTWPAVFRHYDAVFVLDDDIQISGTDISHLFRILTRYDLLLLQPSFSTVGKISHPITVTRLGSFARYTNLVENGVVMFARPALERFLAVYDPCVVGWGTDWWYMHVLRNDVAGRAAVIDAVACINPDERLDGTARKIDLLQSTDRRRQTWEQVAAELGITMPSGGVRCLGALRPRSAEDHLAVWRAPLSALARAIMSEHRLMRLRRVLWRLSWRLQGSPNAW